MMNHIKYDVKALKLKAMMMYAHLKDHNWI